MDYAKQSGILILKHSISKILTEENISNRMTKVIFIFILFIFQSKFFPKLDIQRYEKERETSE